MDSYNWQLFLDCRHGVGSTQGRVPGGHAGVGLAEFVPEVQYMGNGQANVPRACRTYTFMVLQTVVVYHRGVFRSTSAAT